MVFIVMFNLGIAIIIDGYEDAKSIILHQKFEDQRVPFVQDFLQSVIKRSSMKVRECFLRMSSSNRKGKVSAAATSEGRKSGVNADKRNVVSRLAHDGVSASQQHMFQLVQQINAEKNNMTPASQLKDKFKGNVEKQFHRMYASDALATYCPWG